ncbi:TetR/AcrR family transcriptional repressor of nem operon [Oxalobacteraceae bacterium GrIS 2.11]
MKVSKLDMDENHDRIVKGASRLFRERGVKNTSVADAMADAGMTHGGFYRHFNSKEELLVEALNAAFDEFASVLEQRMETVDPKSALEEYRKLYLSKGHLDNPGLGCAMPSLAGDLAHESVAVKEEFGAGFNRVVDAVSRGMKGSEAQRRKAAMRELAMLVGAIVIGRSSDEKTADALLAACRS